MEANTNMEVRRPENPSCTFSTTGICKCSESKKDSEMATETSKQSTESIKGVAKS